MTFLPHKFRGSPISTFLLCGCLFFSIPACIRQNQVKDKPVLEVNGTLLTSGEFAHQLSRHLKEFDSISAKSPEQVKRVKDDILRNFIVETLTREWASDNGIKVTSEEVQEEVNELRSKYPDDLSLRRMLARENLSLETWERSLQFNLLKKKVIEKMTADLSQPTEEEMKNYYESNRQEFVTAARVRLRQIVVARESDADRIMEQLRRGAKLADLARQYSIAPEAEQEGDTGWIEKGVLEVFDQAFEMREGSRSAILKSPYGFHIYEVIAKRKGGRLSFEDSKDRILKALMAKREQKVYMTWLEEQIRKAKVLRNDRLVEAIQVQTRGN